MGQAQLSRFLQFVGLSDFHELHRYSISHIPEFTDQVLSYGELAARVSAAGAKLKSLGVQKGDAIAIHLPMLPDTVVALIAAARIGAVAVPLFSGYGPSAIE